MCDLKWLGLIIRSSLQIISPRVIHPSVERFPQFFGGFALSLTVSVIILTERGRKCESFYFSSNFNAVFCEVFILMSYVNH
jgi:hypothetical protein